MEIKSDYQKYINNNLVCFSINIKQKKNKENIYKKEITYPKDWEKFTINNHYFNENYNGLSLITGKINNIIVVDIDNLEHWNLFLKENGKEEPNTVKAISGSGGIHLYFKYSDDLGHIKTSTKCFGKKYDIDIRNNGGNIILPPTSYFNMNINDHCKYKWEKNIFDYKLKKFPGWMKKILLGPKTNSKKKINNNIEILQNNNDCCCDVDKEDENLNFSVIEIEKLLDMLDLERSDNYNDWISVGLCLHNISDKYLLLWEKWSQNSPKYVENECEKNWLAFKKDKDGLKIGSLLMWAKSDSPKRYDEFIVGKKFGTLVKQKYPTENLLLGEKQQINDRNCLVHLKNNNCLIGGKEHLDMPNSMYIDILDKFMTVKCRHPECFGKSYPCNHILMNKNEMNIVFNGDITININKDDDLVEFQQIDIYDDPRINELVFNSLNGEAYSLAELIYHYYENDFIFSEDDDWYMFSEHRWKCIGKKNMNLRHFIQPKLKSLYSSLISHYKETNDTNDKNKIKTIKQTIKSFDNTLLKNNILTELIEIYSVNKNSDRNFTKKLDSYSNLIGFNNGVFDLNTFQFRNGKPEDFITMTVGYNYSPNHTEKYPELLTFLQDIQPNKQELDYMLTYLSIGLVGNLLELFTILTGCGRNGKSKLIELLKATFGDYFGSVQSQLFTRPRPDANSPDPGLLNLFRKRIVIASEPEKNSKLNSGFIKFITGRDSTTLRNCHSNDMIDFTANFITLLICNDIPDCDDIDNAFSKRLRCIHYPTEFVSEPTKDNQKKIDVNINKNFDLWKFDFILLLIEYYKKYTESHELKPTEEILKWTNLYKKNTDMYLQFLDEYVEETDDEKDKIHCSVLYSYFKSWYKNNNPNTKVPNNKEFMVNIRRYKNIKESLRIGNKVQGGFDKHILKNQNE